MTSNSNPQIAEYTARITQLTILPKGDTIFSENATTISIEDEASGEYLKIQQFPDNPEPATIHINPEEWAIIRKGIDRILREITDYEQP